MNPNDHKKPHNYKKYLKITYLIFIHLFAIAGLFLVGGFFAIKFHLTNNGGIIDEQQRYFLDNLGTTASSTNSTSSAPITHSSGQQAFDAYVSNQPEWNTFKSAVLKDKTLIEQVGAVSGIKSRVIVSVLATEQLRFFFTDRASFKQFFEPLKILGNETQFSWGVMGIKEDTAKKIESNLKDTTSPYYLGPTYEHLLDFPSDVVNPADPSIATTTVDELRFSRITDKRNRYYAYLYGALFIKQVEQQWKNAGYDISNRPEILSTLFDLGFSKSKPNPDPKVGGAVLTINGNQWSFGGLTYDMYYSNELPEFAK